MVEHRPSKIKQGGNALKEVGVVRISKSDIPATILYISQLSGVLVTDLFPLGSTGKTANSGDIDLAIDINKYDYKTIHAVLTSILGEQNTTYNPGTKVGSYAVPIAGDIHNGRVQVDFMYVPNPIWAQFSYASPGDASEYKGAVRRILLQSVASSLNQKNIDVFLYDKCTNELVIRVGRTFDMNLGLKRIFQIRPKRVKGTGYVSTMKTVTPEELQDFCPELTFPNDYMIVDDPLRALHIMFGINLTTDQVNTTEQIVELIKQNFSNPNQRIIFDRANQKLKTVAHQMAVPTL